MVLGTEDTQGAAQMVLSQWEIKRTKWKKGEEGTKREGRALYANCCDPLVPRQSCHFKKWSNIINGGLWGLTSCSNSPVPRPSHYYGRPSSIKIQSLLWLVWLRRATAQRRGSDPLLPLPGSPQRLEQVLATDRAQSQPFRLMQSQSKMLKFFVLFSLTLVSMGRGSCQTMVRHSLQKWLMLDEACLFGKRKLNFSNSLWVMWGQHPRVILKKNPNTAPHTLRISNNTERQLLKNAYAVFIFIFLFIFTSTQRIFQL